VAIAENIGTGGWVNVTPVYYTTTGTASATTLPTQYRMDPDGMIRPVQSTEEDLRQDLAPGAAGQEEGRTMAIATVDDLATVPVGEKVYVKDQPIWRVDSDWWTTEEGGRALLRDRQVHGYVGKGLVTTADEREVPIGAVALGRTCYYVAEKVDTNYVYCTRIRREDRQGYEPWQYLNGNHAERITWFRANRYTPTAEQSANILRVMTEFMLEARAERTAALNAQHTAEETLTSERNKTARFRGELRDFLGL
jgi:hypothetical protein